MNPSTNHDAPALALRFVPLFPRVGDEWEFKLPGKSKKLKVVDRIHFDEHRGEWDFEKCRYAQSWHFRVHWKRQNKGRYTSLRVKALLKYGRRLSTKAERDQHFLDQVNRRRAVLGKQPLQRDTP
jgi:hypothetical protein